MKDIEAVLLADAPEALTKVCGISLMERLLRMLQQLGFRRATVVSRTPEMIQAELAKPSWARAKVTVDLAAEIPFSGAERALIIPANVYCDIRLLRALCEKSSSTALVDSNPPEFARGLTANPCGPRLQVHGSNSVESLDAAEVDDYIVSMRRHLRPVCVVAQNTAMVERIILDSAQKGTLDIPARVHAPIEKWIVSYLCKTRLTPNQITIITAIISASVAVQFACGWLVSGTLLALLVGILDGVDGKQARVKVEMTELGEWEHKVDAVLEASWWLALGLHFQITYQIRLALLFPIALLLAHVVDGVARRYVQRNTGRSIDDLTLADRALRLVAGRRNIYTWIFAVSLVFNAPVKGFLAFCFWGIASCLSHVIRAFFIKQAGAIDSNRPV